MALRFLRMLVTRINVGPSAFDAVHIVGDASALTDSCGLNHSIIAVTYYIQF
jgi:hypothetical protein